MSTSSNSVFLRLPQVRKKIPVSKSTWWQWISDGYAPQGIRLGKGGCTVWLESDIDAFIERELQQSRANDANTAAEDFV